LIDWVGPFVSHRRKYKEKIMQKVILLAVLGLSVNAFAASEYADCKAKESDKACVQRIVKASEVMNQNFYTGKPSERPMIFNAIYSNSPSSVVVQETGEGGTVFSQYVLIYPVAATEYSGLKAATFTATLEKSLEDSGKKPKVVGRSVHVSSIKILTGEAVEQAD
jgi:hypothetical protein